MDSIDQLRGAAKASRKRRSLNQEDVAIELGKLGVEITGNAYAKFEHGTRGLKFEEAVAIAQVLDLDLTAITRSVSADVLSWIERDAEDLYDHREVELESARDHFEEAARRKSLTREFRRAVSGEKVTVRMRGSEFAIEVLIDAVNKIPGDVVEFFEEMGDAGEVRKLVDTYTWSWEKSSSGLKGQVEAIHALGQGMAQVLRQTVPNLEFADG